jgi:hypothetical protein
MNQMPVAGCVQDSEHECGFAVDAAQLENGWRLGLHRSVLPPLVFDQSVLLVQQLMLGVQMMFPLTVHCPAGELAVQARVSVRSP